MKKVVVRTGLLCAIVLVFATCSKLNPDFFKPHGKNDCDVQSYYLSLTHVPSPFLFEKTYNAAGNRVTEIACSFFDFSYDAVSYHLRLVYHGMAIYLVDKNNDQDTVMKIYLNPKGRVKECFGKFDVNYTRFAYDAHNRLSNVSYSWGFPTMDTCEYDQYGNILLIAHDELSGERNGSFFEYDYSKKCKRQFYRDEPSINNDFTLLQYLGFFPELEPVHVRTYVKMGLETNPFWWNKSITNHRFDSKGRLIGYDMVDYSEDIEYLHYQAIVNWKCN